MEANSIQKNYISKKLIEIQDFLSEKYNGLFLNDDMLKDVEDEIREMLNQYITNTLKIEELKYDILISNNNGSLNFSIKF